MLKSKEQRQVGSEFLTLLFFDGGVEDSARLLVVRLSYWK